MIQGKVKIYTDIDLLPNIQKYLPLISSEKLFYKEHGLKHPSAIYNSSFGKTEGATKDFFDAYDLLIKAGFEDRKDEVTPVLKSYRHLLYTLREHLDDCLHVIKAFVKPPENEREQRNQYEWLKLNAKDTVEQFFLNIAEYKRYLDLSVNELKHNNGILGSVAFYSSFSPDDHCAGYFVANVVDDCYEPVAAIHPKFQNTHTGFSFRRDLTYNLYSIYALSEEIMLLLETKMGIDFKTLNPQLTQSEGRRAIFQKLMDMPRMHFPDEYLKPVPSISITAENKLKLEYPSQLSIKPNRLNKVVLTHSPDGHTRTYRVLYM